MTGEHEELVIEMADGSGFVAACLCGWMTEGHPTYETAADDWETHCENVFMEATMSWGDDD